MESATGKSGASALIDWQSQTTVSLGMSADLRWLHEPGTPGREYLRAMPTVIKPERLEYVRSKKDGRLPILERNPHMIIRALHRPEIVGVAPEYRQESKHWSHALAVQNPDNSDQYIALAVSLANFVGDECEEHWLITAYVAAPRNIFKNGEMRADKWKWAKGKPT